MTSNRYATTPVLKGRPKLLTKASSKRAANLTKPWIKPYWTNSNRASDRANAPMKVGHLNALRLK